MHVGFLTYGMRDRLTGVGRYAVELTRALRRLDPSLETTLLNPYPDSTLDWYREFPTYSLPALRLMPGLVTVGNWELHRAASRLKLDILHDPTGVAPFVAPRGAYRRVVTVHDGIPYVYPRTQPLLTQLIFRTLIPLARYTADAVITLSESAKCDLAERAGIPRVKLHVTPLATTHEPEDSPVPVDPVLRRLGVQRPYFLFVGALHPRKNLHRILEAIVSLRTAAPATGLANLVVVGPPSWGARAVHAELLRNTGPGAEVVYLGYVSDRDLDVLYRGALALVFPSLYEGFGLPVLEAMVRGTPVITSSTSSLPEVAGDAALLVDPSSTGAIRAAMERILGDEGLRRTLREKGFQRAKAFSWDDTALKTLEVYRAVLGRS